MKKLKKIIITITGVATLLVAHGTKAADAKLTALTEATSLIYSNLLYATIGGGSSDSRSIQLTNLLESLKALPNWSAPPYTVPITGTNFILDWLALGPTNNVVLTNYAAAGLLNTNVIPGKVIRATVVQGGQGFCTLVPNTNSFGPNFRTTFVQTGITQSTNGGYEDFLVLYGSRTNAVLSGQNWGARP